MTTLPGGCSLTDIDGVEYHKAGVVRRTTVRVATPGVGAGAGGIGGPATGVGVRPGAGAGRAGVGVNRGGPVNRVGVR